MFSDRAERLPRAIKTEARGLGASNQAKVGSSSDRATLGVAAYGYDTMCFGMPLNKLLPVICALTVVAFFGTALRADASTLIGVGSLVRAEPLLQHPR